MKYIGLLESPSPRKMELITLYAVINGIPIKQIVRYVIVPGTASAGVDITFTIGLTNNKRSDAITKDTSMNNVIVFPMTADTRFLSLAPTA